MPYDSLGDFLTVLHDHGDVTRIAAVVDPNSELAAITDQTVRRHPLGGPALWFANCGLSGIPVIANLLGHPTRLCRALGIDAFPAAERLLVDDTGELLPGIVSGQIPARYAPKTVRQAPCQQVIKLGKDVSLWDLPTVRSGPLEPYPALTGGVVVVRDPETQAAVLSEARLQVVDRQRLLPYWPTGDARLEQARSCQNDRKQMPVAIVIGGDPLLDLAAEAEVWQGSSVDYPWLGQLRRKPLDVVKCRSHDLDVPADAELVIEGFIDPDVPWETLTKLALSNGRYSGELVIPAIQVTAITHRANPISRVVIPSRAVGEHDWQRECLDRMYFPTLRWRSRTIRQFARPLGSQGATVFVGIAKQQPFAARQVAHAIWSTPGLARTTLLVVVDDDVSVRNEGDIWNAVARNVDPQRDVWTERGACDPGHLAMTAAGVGGKLCIDATRKLPAEGGPAEWPDEVRYSQELLQGLAQRWRDLGLTDETGERA